MVPLKSPYDRYKISNTLFQSGQSPYILPKTLALMSAKVPVPGKDAHVCKAILRVASFRRFRVSVLKRV